jgi:acetylornithine deacetylase/succinyl-diaminopimelate desuccinylase-like protein
MNKRLTTLTTKQALSDFTTKLTAKWALLTQPNTPAELSDDETVVDILRDIVGMPTITGNYEANHEALDYIDHFLSERGLYVKRLKWNGFESLVATTQQTKTPTVFLMGHMDVVPAPEALFQLTEKEDSYMGRGVIDMKTGIAAFLASVKDLEGDLRDYDFGIMIVTDEEIGGFDGAQKLAEEGYIPKVMVVPDGGGNWNMEAYAKGVWHFTIEATGKSAHGSRPWEGENAIDKLNDTLHEINALFAGQGQETSTVNVGIIQGGDAINQIPSFASASIDVRPLNKAEQTRLTAAVNDIIKKNNLTITTEVIANPVQNDIDNSYLKAYAACSEQVLGHTVKWVTSYAGNDGRFFADKGVPLACAYPAGGNHHGPEEWITKEAPFQLQAIITNFLKEVAYIKKEQ